MVIKNAVWLANSDVYHVMKAKLVGLGRNLMTLINTYDPFQQLPQTHPGSSVLNCF